MKEQDNLYLSGLKSAFAHDITRLIAFLKENPDKAEVDVTINPLYSQDAEDLKDLFNFIKFNSSITILDIRGTTQKCWDIGLLSEVLKSNRSITNLTLSNIHVNNLEIFLSEVLKFNTTITTLDLSCNYLGAEGVKNLVPNLNSITNLNLRGNYMYDEGIKYISDLLKVNTAVKILDISWNWIGSKGIESITDDLKANTVLTNLNLANNKITDNGLKCIIDVLSVNSILINLDLSDNCISQEYINSFNNARIVLTFQPQPDITGLNVIGDSYDLE